MQFNTLCAPQLPVEKYVETDDTFECDYDQNPTSLYEALEDHAWHPALQFLETGFWEKGLFLMQVPDPLPPQRQARTWVTRLEEGVVRWSQLPIHAALIFGAPYQVVNKIIELYPQGVRCTDDQHMLPLHLAMKFGASDSVVACLLQLFPESLFTRDVKGRLPTELVTSPRNQIMESIINVMQKKFAKKHTDAVHKTTAELRDDLKLQTKLNSELERDKKELESNCKRAQAEIAVLKMKMEEMKMEMKQNVIEAESTKLSSRSKSRTRRPKEETRDGVDSTASVGGGASIRGDARYQSNGKAQRVQDKMESRRNGSVASSIGGDSRVVRTAKFLKAFGSVKE